MISVSPPLNQQKVKLPFGASQVTMPGKNLPTLYSILIAADYTKGNIHDFYGHYINLASLASEKTSMNQAVLPMANKSL